MPSGDQLPRCVLVRRHACPLPCGLPLSHPAPLRRIRSSDGRDQCLEEHASAADREQLALLSARLAPPWDALMSRAGWYDEYVEPIRALSPRECSDGHVADPAFGELKSELDRLLQASPWFAQNIAPLRRAGGWAR